jgi:predicted DNA-binding transcriptional regulator AlpA
MKERISPGKAADICGISRDTLIKLAKRGIVPGAVELVPRLWRFDERRLRHWIRLKEAECQSNPGIGNTSRNFSIDVTGSIGSALSSADASLEERYERALSLRLARGKKKR